MCVMMLMACSTEAKKKYDADPGKIIYIPIDNRPISLKQTVAVAEKLGYEMVVPPDELLGNRDFPGNPDGLWQWLEENADLKNLRAAVIASDSMIYGSLVGSRKHELDEAELTARAERFFEFHKDHKKLPLYVFSSIMRTPRSGAASGHEEPEYYRSYGADIFRYTALIDKQELEGLNRREKKEIAFLEKLIPRTVLSDWMERRKKNFDANKHLIDLAKKKTFRYLLLGRDDNAPYCQTHLESRYLTKYGSGLGKETFQSTSGIDEIGMLMLTRAINERVNNVPLVYVKYNWGKGGQTIPAYSDVPIEDSIDEAIAAAGGVKVPRAERADFVLAVSTNPNGKTAEAMNAVLNDGKAREGTNYFVDTVNDYVSKGYKVAVADIAFSNGADNALMEEMRNRNLLFKLQAYGGWNTATNTTGFVLSTAMLSKMMPDGAIDDLLVTRYLDDWAYQANVRNIMARQLTWLRGDGYYGKLGDKRDAVSDRTTRLLERFVEQNLPPFAGSEYMKVIFPWGRMFEADILVGRDAEESIERSRPHIVSSRAE
ncbi:MAG: DUF4127 family protein [Selenomonadaceae bacterium]|nr:DUF4127 family protein [Selenomonadaceae bacterium]